MSNSTNVKNANNKKQTEPESYANIVDIDLTDDEKVAIKELIPHIYLNFFNTKFNVFKISKYTLNGEKFYNITLRDKHCIFTNKEHTSSDYTTCIIISSKGYQMKCSNCDCVGQKTPKKPIKVPLKIHSVLFPNKVIKYTNQHKDTTSDKLIEWFNNYYIITNNPDDYVLIQEMYDIYINITGDLISLKIFSNELNCKLNVKKVRKRIIECGITHQHTSFIGVKLKNEDVVEDMNE